MNSRDFGQRLLWHLALLAVAFLPATPIAAQPRWEASETFPSRDPQDIVAVGDSMLYVATRDLGLLRSDDGGRTWVVSQVLTMNTYSIGVGTDGTMIVSAGTDTGGIFRGRVGEDTWTDIGAGDVQFASSAMITSDGFIYAKGQHCLYRTTPDRVGWDTIFRGFYANDRPLCLWADSTGLVLSGLFFQGGGGRDTPLKRPRRHMGHAGKAGQTRHLRN